MFIVFIFRLAFGSGRFIVKKMIIKNINIDKEFVPSVANKILL